MQTVQFSSEASLVNSLIEKNLVHSVHTSSRLSFRGCRRRHHWIFVDGYYPTVTPKPLEFGKAFHVGMEKYYDPQTWHDRETASAIAQAAFVQTCKDQYAEYLKLNQGNIDPDAKADYKERIQLGLGMIRYYTKYISPEHDTNFKPVKVEIEFEVPIKSPEGEYLWCKCNRCRIRFENSEYGQSLIRNCNIPSGWTPNPNSLSRYNGDVHKLWYMNGVWQGLPVTYGGRIDMLAEDELGRYWVFDWKTTSRMTGTPGSEDDFMLLDDQITSYCWALWTLGIPVVGFVYVEIKKAVPEEPEPNKVQRLGRWYSVNRQIATTYEIYYRTVAENDPQALAAGYYDDFLEYLKSTEGPRFHKRSQIFRSETELENAGRHIWMEAREMTNPNLLVYPSPGRFSCGNCAFQDPCLAKNRGEDYQYTLDTLFQKKETHYWEERLSTDTRGGR